MEKHPKFSATIAAFQNAINSYENTQKTTQFENSLIEATQILEKKYESRGLKFTTSFEGLVPVQAYGHLDGMRFYFRFRGNSGSLTLGRYDTEVEEAYAREANDRRARREHSGFTHFQQEPQREDDPRYYPTQPVLRAILDDYIPGEVFAGSVTKPQAVELFSYLADHLTEA